MFGRRKHAAPVVAAPTVPQLTDEVIFAAVHARVDAMFGSDGDWTVVPRSGEQADRLFHDVFVHSLASAVTSGVAAAREALHTEEGARAALRVPKASPRPAPEASDDEPAALRWEPAPITRWADLKRPVTGPVAIADGDDKAA